MTTTGDRISDLRTQLDLNQDEFVSACGISHQTYLSELENDKRPLTAKTAKLMEKAFNTSADWLLTGVGEMFPTEETVRKRELQKQRSGTSRERLRMWRESVGLTQQEVADTVGGYTQSGIYAAESRKSGDVSRKLATKLQMKYGLSRSWLLEGDGSMMLTDSKPNTVEGEKPQYNSLASPKAETAQVSQEVLDRLSALELDMKMVKKMLSND